MDIVEIIFQSYSEKALDKSFKFKEIQAVNELENEFIESLSKSQRLLYNRLEDKKIDEEVKMQKELIQYVISFYKTLFTSKND